MKHSFKVIILGMFCISACIVSINAFVKKTPNVQKQFKNTVVVKYDLKKIPTRGSNQVAIWVEDASGKFVRNLFATRFTAKGGYINRSASLKTWVTKSEWKNASKDEVDALSSATQAAGSQFIGWDCKDAKGVKVTKGTYIICMEGNLRDGKMMYAKALISVGKKKQTVVADLSFIPDEGKVEPLFENVTVQYIK